MSKTIPKEEVTIWFNVHNMVYEKIELFGDVFKSLNQIIVDTYLGEESNETKIALTKDDKKSHFDWCWNKMVQNFKKENITLNVDGEHKEYFEEFFMETFYNQSETTVKKNITNFIEDVFNTQKDFTKSDLDILTELYKLLEKNMN